MEKIKKTIKINNNKYNYYSLTEFAKENDISLNRLPYSIRILLENMIRNCDNQIVKESDILKLARWNTKQENKKEIAFYPSRVIMQDFTGVPAVVDLAAMRDAAIEKGKDPAIINPVIKTDLIIDHSIQVDYFGTEDSYKKNLNKEYERNSERYKLLKWAQKNFDNLKVFPPGAGIIHQVNLEFISDVVTKKDENSETLLIPDTLIGTDSHTTMINGIGVLGWGVGGIEAEAVMMGQAYYMTIPEVVGVKMTGTLREGVTTTDLVLTVTERLRKAEVVEKFVEFFGPALKNMTLPDRATISNMAPEYGATCGFFPVDEQTINFLKLTNREESSEITEIYCKEQDLFYSDEIEPEYSKLIEFDLSEIKPSIAGPKRPQDRFNIEDIKESFRKGFPEYGNNKDISFEYNKKLYEMNDGSVVIAAITSCTNTSNPVVMIGAGLLAKKAYEKGLRVKPYIKTSLAPGSKVVTDYLKKSDLLYYLEKLGFFVVGYGCTTCIGNSGPIPIEVKNTIIENDLVAASILSGNRNFEARIHSDVKANYLASPPLVIAYSIAGRVDIDLTKEPLGYNNNNPVFLKDIWPSSKEINDIIDKIITPDMFKEKYSDITEGDLNWKNLKAAKGIKYNWNQESTFIRKPPFFKNFSKKPIPVNDIIDARILLLLGDSVTTDHISPAGNISENYPAGKYLKENNIKVSDFNTYGSRRGNHEVMMRGTFANIRIKNKLLNNIEGGYSLKFPEKEKGYVYDIASKYKADETPLIVIGGKEYGTGSSRDWAAKGTMLLNIKAVIAESFERIHRSNLIGMGVLPLEFTNGENADTLKLTGEDLFTINEISELTPGAILKCKAVSTSRSIIFDLRCRLDTSIEVDYFKSGGILKYVFAQKILN